MDKHSCTRIFIPLSPPIVSNSLDSNELIIKDGDAHHIKNVLRMRVGDEITVCYKDGSEFIAEVAKIDDFVKLDIKKKVESDSELPISVTLFQAYPKGDKFDLIVQKCTELGITKIVPVISERCISRPNAKSQQHKQSRLSRIAENAARQSGRTFIPKITETISFENAMEEIAKEDCGFVCYEGGSTTPLTTILKDYNGGNFSFFIGPEGGLSLTEVEQALAYNITLAGLGKRILRTETAPIFVMSAVSLLFC